jgi:N utilization substance protein A
MSKTIYNADTLKIMTLFDSVTKSKLKDCFYDDNGMLTFIVEPNEIGKAIGRRAVNIRKLEGLLRKKIKIVEFHENPMEFIKNLLYPLNDVEVSEEEGKINLKAKGSQAKAMLIGRNGSNLKNTQGIVSKYFNTEVKVV